MNIEQARFNMIEQQIRPCEDFAPAAYRNLAFADMEIPIGSGQVMLAPRIEARLLQELGIQNTDKVLEIGAGSGYMAALLAARAEYVISIESRPELADFARQNLARADVANVTVEVGNGINGWAQRGPYDAIVVSGSLPALPDALLKQLRVGGRLVAIVGKAPVMEAQLVTCSSEGIYNTINLFETVVPALDGAEARTGFSF